MKKLERDFITLFNALWYRDFPLSRNMSDMGRITAMFTAHINGVVKACADLVGHYIVYEQGRRTDAMVITPAGRVTMMIEIEWKEAQRDDVNEVDQLSLAASAQEADSFVFVNYTEIKWIDDNLASITRAWKSREKHMILFLVTHEYTGKRRVFDELRTYIITRGKAKLVRRQKALPWEVKDTRWSALSKQ